LNNYIDTLVLHTANFFYEETAPSVFLPVSQLSYNENSPLKSVYYEVSNGTAVEVSAEGGIKASSNPTDATVIWFDKAKNRTLKIISTNKFDAWSLKEFKVEVEKF
jgi:hypothetical protein